MKKYFFIFLFSLVFINCGRSSDPNPRSEDPTRNFIIEPTREVARDLNCPKPEKNNPFIEEVVSYHIGPGGGYNEKNIQKSSLNNILFGPPQGTGTHKGSVDTFSLGQGGWIVVKMGVPILDGEGSDFIIFENVFYAADDPNQPYMEPAEIWVSKSEEGPYIKFPCEGANWRNFYPGCAGVNPVFANPLYNQIDPTDPKTAGGDSFDLKTVGLNCVQYIKIKDATSEVEENLPTDQAGFDLDAIVAIYY